eukprot:498203_1
MQHHIKFHGIPPPSVHPHIYTQRAVSNTDHIQSQTLQISVWRRTFHPITINELWNPKDWQKGSVQSKAKKKKRKTIGKKQSNAQDEKQKEESKAQDDARKEEAKREFEKTVDDVILKSSGCVADDGLSEKVEFSRIRKSVQSVTDRFKRNQKRGELKQYHTWKTHVMAEEALVLAVERWGGVFGVGVMEIVTVVDDAVSGTKGKRGGRRTKGKSGKAAHGKRYFIKRGLVAAYKKLDAAKKDKAVAWLKDNALDVTNYVLRLGESVDEAKRLGLIYRFS